MCALLEILRAASANRIMKLGSLESHTSLCDMNKKKRHVRLRARDNVEIGNEVCK